MNSRPSPPPTATAAPRAAASASTAAAQDYSRSAGAAYVQAVEHEKTGREKSRNLRPLGRLWGFVRPYPGQLIAFLIFLVLSALGSLGMPWIVKLIIDCGFGDGQAGIPACAAIAQNTENALNGYFLAAGLFSLFFATCSALRFFFITRLGQRVIADIRMAVFNQLTLLSPAYFEKVRTGEVLSRLTTDTTLIETVITGSISFALRSVAQIIGALFMMFFLSWQLALMVLAIAPAMIIPLVLTGKKIKRYSRDSQDRLAEASARAGEALGSIQTVQAYAQEANERAHFAADIEASFQAQHRRIRVQSVLTGMLFSIALVGTLSILNFGAWSVLNGKMTNGDITAFVFLAFLAIAGASSLTQTFTNLLRAAGAADRLVEILNEEPTIQAPDQPKELPTPKALGHITFDNVNFSYPTRPDSLTLRNMSFVVQPGETVALVGPSGAGKSTVFQLLLRFYDVQSGSVTLDDLNIAQFAPDNLRRQFAVVQQGAPLFSGTPTSNIGYGDPAQSDNPDQAAIIQAAKAAYADDFITALPDGYDSDLGEQGATLSGGQKQRIAIARAVLRDAPILLLDEATSALDSESEQAVQMAFDQISKTRTTLVIAHRLSTVLRADRILVLDKGEIVETGTHKELMKQNGLYARLAKIQFDQSTDATQTAHST